MNQIENILTELKQIRQQLHDITEILNPPQNMSRPDILTMIRGLTDDIREGKRPYRPDPGLTRMWEELDQEQPEVNHSNLKELLASLRQKEHE